jgi:hypothetical protein
MNGENMPRLTISAATTALLTSSIVQAADPITLRGIGSLHVGGLTGAIWETTPDGHEGWLKRKGLTK